MMADNTDTGRTKRLIPHATARNIASRLIASAFRNPDKERARFSIPADPEHDDDLLINSYISQQEEKEEGLAAQSTDLRLALEAHVRANKLLMQKIGFSTAQMEKCTSQARTALALWAPTHQHRKGGMYRVIRRGVLETDLTPVVIYDAEDGTTWVRPASEFDDGRFTPVTAAATAPEVPL